MKPAMIAILVLVILTLSFLSMSQGTSVQGFGDYGKTNANGTFIMYYADWCPACKQAKPLFEEYMKSGYRNINGYKIKLDMIEEKKFQKGVTPDIKGYPTFLYSDAAGKIVEFNGPRNAQGFDEFLKHTILS